MLFARLQSYGIDVAPYMKVSNIGQALEFSKKFGYPVVLKADISGHKTEKGGVMLNIFDEEMLKSAFKSMKRRFGKRQLLIQKQILGGLEVYIGLKRDELFGNVVLLGLGGVYVEVFKDITARVCPINERDAEEMVKELKSSRIFMGFRGRRLSIESLKKTLVAVCRFASKEKVKELDINPAILTEDSCIVVDARMVK